MDEFAIHGEKNSGITSLDLKGDKYIFWNHAEVVLSYIYEYLRKEFPGQLILTEFNHIDLVVLGENLPVEVQSTILLGKSNSRKKIVASSYFEQMIEKQLKQNIQRYGKCWFFFDSEFLRYSNSQISRANRLNLDWLVNYMHDNLLKVFVINYKGDITPISARDLEDILDNVKYNEFENNEILIFSQVLLGNGYSSREIRGFYQNKKLLKDKSAFITWLRKKDQPKREKLLGYILFTISGDLRDIDKFFAQEEFDWNRVSSAASFLGIFEYENKLWSIEDKYDVIKYFHHIIKINFFGII